jgi:hypothetical protein
MKETELTTSISYFISDWTIHNLVLHVIMPLRTVSIMLNICFKLLIFASQRFSAITFHIKNKNKIDITITKNNIQSTDQWCLTWLLQNKYKSLVMWNCVFDFHRDRTHSDFCLSNWFGIGLNEIIVKQLKKHQVFEIYNSIPKSC